MKVCPVCRCNMLDGYVVCSVECHEHWDGRTYRWSKTEVKRLTKGKGRVPRGRTVAAAKCKRHRLKDPSRGTPAVSPKELAARVAELRRAKGLPPVEYARD